jgi:tRNA(fMet)-specific endonuclease VapC
MYLLDTDHVTFLQMRTQPEYGRIMQRIALQSAAAVFASLVSMHEQVMGANSYISQARTAADVVRGYHMLELARSFYAVAQMLPFDQQAANVFASMRAQRVRIGTMDLRIASIALSRGLAVVTRNTGDFNQVPGLAVEDWTV